ncbi:hypothetical protein SDC9_189890 [bioreactor metagenome]|uniref:RND related beta-barrel domain-containing protein n=1 Tax=bioreactor metagenome TaxID=1076179 RepID=A0A645I4C4_9ZZZZ
MNKTSELTGVKVVDNTEWYISCIVAKSDLNGMKAGKKVKIRLKNIGNESVDAYIHSISNTSGDASVVTIRINHDIEEFYKHRYAELDIIKDQYKGFLIPTKALLKKEGITGIYAVKSGIIRFIPVKILFSDSSNTLVTDADKKDIEALNSELYKLKQYDEVVTTTKRVKENQYIMGQ